MPRLVIRVVIFDDQNRRHATARATERQLREVLIGAIEAAKNRKGATADYLVTAKADDGTKWTVAFNYDAAEQSARPITAWQAK